MSIHDYLCICICIVMDIQLPLHLNLNLHLHLHLHIMRIYIYIYLWLYLHPVVLVSTYFSLYLITSICTVCNLHVQMYIIWSEHHQQTLHIDLRRLVSFPGRRSTFGQVQEGLLHFAVRSLTPATSALGNGTWRHGSPKPLTGHKYKFMRMLVFCWYLHNRAQFAMLLHVTVANGIRILMAKILELCSSDA